MPSIRLEYLFRQYLNQELSADENRELMLLLQQQSNDAAVKEWLDGLWSNLTIENRLSESKADALFNAILAADRGVSMQTALRPVRRLFTVPRLRGTAAAAVLLLCISAGAWYFFFKKPAPSTVQSHEPAHLINDLPPGTNNAVLVLADGKRINLDSTANGEIAKQENTTIAKKDGMVVYNGSHSPLTTDHSPYNTLTTARGNQYQLLLPDGSKVWLNAESSVRFPVAFNGTERRVEITGEVFFDVVHNAKMPFSVLANGVEVQDLGTQFNVNAYGNEEGVRTTVVEGKVNVQLAIGNRQSTIGNNQKTIGNRQSAILAPGQQAQVSDKGTIKIVKDADVDAAVAWKNGQFMFAGNSIQSVMRQLERWYDIEVSYAPNVSKEEYIGTITRFSNISAVLNMLERTGTVRFELKGRRVMVK